ncbi:MAG TPA: GIY-YIG nuclease family protein [Pyrinomonadaceae bacterium]
MLNLLDIPDIKNLPPGKFKIHLATSRNPTPFDAFVRGNFTDWQAQQNAKNFECDTIVSLIALEVDQWLFAGVYKFLGVSEGTESPYYYQTELILGLDDFIGRVIVHYHRPSRASYIWGSKYAQFLEVSEIRQERMSVERFSGFNHVVVPYHRLLTVARLQEPTWKSALSSVKGVYLIADTSNGKGYVGSATGEGGIWARWESYAFTGHGGNIELKELLDAVNGKGPDHVHNFQYSILETADSHASIEYILSREAHWKKALLSHRPFGYNCN